MAKKPTVTTIASGYASTTTLNNNFEALREGFDNTLSLDGSTPNAMQADLDMDGNDILDAGSIIVGGQDLLAATQANLSAAAVAQAAADAAVTAAETSETNAATSATSASTSASNAATSASQAASSALSASGSATASATSALAAENAETNAETAETNAETAETNAQASALAALASEIAAANSEVSVEANRATAEAAATAAAASETAAAASETNAATSADEAEAFRDSSALNAAISGASATNAQIAATSAAASETAAATSETNAAISAADAAFSAANAAANSIEASNFATAAASSSSSASTSADQAAGSASSASTSETNAATSETNAASSASASATSATASAASATAASASENAANTSAINADFNATAAGVSETNAAASATTATTKASEASVSATAAATSATDSEAARDQSQDARDTANLHKLAAEAAATSATNTAAALTGFDLEAIAESKAVTAVDVFVYDTSKDSDGGAWRKRTQGTSWYQETLNTATRGSRREFPAVAVIVAESDTLTIYDGDDPSLPMWMVFPRNGNDFLYTTSVCATILNGTLCIGIYPNDADGNFWDGGLKRVDFISDVLRSHSYEYSKLYGNTVSERTLTYSTGLGTAITTSGSIINANVNDVAMTVLPNAPIDAATGLPVPTIAVATDGGVSVIKDDGTVVDITGQSFGATYVSFRGSQIVSNFALSSELAFFSIPTGDVTISSFTERYYSITSTSDPANPKLLRRVGGAESFAETAFRSGSGLTHLSSGLTSSSSMVAYTTSTYNTGWMNGDIKGAFLSDTDDTDLVGSGELVTNGTFDTDTTGWSANGGAVLSVVSNTLKVENNGSFGGAFYTVTTVVGQVYTLSFDLVEKSGGNDLNTFNLPDGTFVPTSGVGTYAATFTATSTSSTITAAIGGNTVGHFKRFDNISVKLADADRSVNANGLIVNGTVTRSPVATGADLVAYSGFSASNYLEQPYNSDLDFGTGDFCIMGWVKSTNTDAARIAYRANGTATPNRYALDITSGPIYRVFVVDGSSTAFVCSGTTGPNNTWQFVVGLRRSGQLELYVDGVLEATSGGVVDVTNTNATLKVGTDTAYPLTGSLALLRISATAPSPEQIKKIYEDEKVLFQENAQATLYGSSDAVTALAHDDATDLLHVGTSAGRSVFQGLRRVSNTTTAVGVAISASNNLVAEE